VSSPGLRHGDKEKLTNAARLISITLPQQHPPASKKIPGGLQRAFHQGVLSTRLVLISCQYPSAAAPTLESLLTMPAALSHRLHQPA
jgi:hypothetical protein